jgi:repressor LexA
MEKKMQIHPALTPVQQEIHSFVRASIKKEQRPPTYQEIGTAVQITNLNMVVYHLERLEKYGLLIRQPRLRDQKQGWEHCVIKLTLPVKGRIAAEEPLEVFDDVEQVLDAGVSMAQCDVYVLQVKGPSLTEDHLCNGDYVVVREQLSCVSNDVIVAIYGQGAGARATIKRFSCEGDDVVRLLPAYPSADAKPNPPVGARHIPKQVWDQEWQVQGRVLVVVRLSDTKGTILSCPALNLG